MSIKDKTIDLLKDNFYVGTLSIIVGFTATLFDGFLGFFMGLIIFPVGIYAVIISKRPIWLKVVVLALAVVLLLFRFKVLHF